MSEVSKPKKQRAKRSPFLGDAEDLDLGELGSVLNEQDKIDELTRANLSLLKSLEKSKASKADYVAAVYAAVRDAMGALTFKPVPKPKKDARRKKGEVAVAVCSDWQLAKTTPTYTSEICEQRIERFAEKVIEITEVQRVDHPVRECQLWLLGDIIEGELIFPGQHWLIDASLYRQVVVDGPRILKGLIDTLLANFDKVVVYSVDGNHGRIGGRSSRDMHPESNGDRMLYSIVKQMYEQAGETRLEWHLAEHRGEKNWYAVAEVGNYRSLLMHGDQIRGGFAGFPFYGLAKKVWGWKSGGIPEDFNDVFIGHWHTPTKVTLNTVQARCNGSTESYNTYASESLAAMGRASQHLMYVHPERGEVTAEYQVWLTDDFYGDA